MISKKTNKLILTVLLFLIISVLLGIKNIVLGFTITSIDGRTYRISDKLGDADYGIGKLYNEIMSVDTQIINQELNKNNTFLKIGYKIGITSASENSFNRNGTFFDCGTESGGCQMVCAEPKNAIGNNNEYTKVQKILFISEDGIKLYYSDTNQITETKLNNKDKAYFKKILREGFEVKNKGNTDRYYVAKHFAKHIRSDNFNSKINGYTNEKWQYEDYDNPSEPNACITNLLDDSGYAYYGIFVWVGTGAAPSNGNPSQGRIIYNVVRRKHSIELSLKKENFAR